MKFEWPFALWLAALFVPLAFALHLWSARKAARRLDGIIAARLREQLVRSVDFSKRWLRAGLVTLGLVFVFVALARPQFGFLKTELERSSVDFLVALDLSRSMLAEDVGGQARLAAARGALNDLLDQLRGDRVGLIAFAGEAFLAAPITEDHAAIRRTLKALDTSAAAKAGSDIAAAIRLAAQTFEKGAFESKALVIVTDGEELQGDAVIAAREAAGKGLTVFTVGVGSLTGARVPAGKPGAVVFAKNEFNREVISRLNERVLQQVAANGRGFYEAFGTEGEGLWKVWERGLAPLAKGVKTRESQEMREYYQWPLALGVALLFAELLINDRRKSRP